MSVSTHPMTFQSFVTGPANVLAYNVALTAARTPGTAYNPVCLVGGTGLGKTHLLQAIAAYARARPHDGEIISTTAALFARQVRDHRGYLSALRRRYRHAALVLLDDIDELAGREIAAGELAGLIHDRRVAARQLVLTASRRPPALVALPAGLRASLETCLIIGLRPPDDATRLAILRHVTARWGSTVPEAALARLAARRSGSVRDLLAALAGLADAAVDGTALTPAVVGQVSAAAARAAPPPRDQVNVEDVLGAVCAYYGLARGLLLSPCRAMLVAQARQVAMYLLREDAGLTTTRVGLELGRDHATVLHGYARIADAFKGGDARIAAVLAAIRREALRRRCA